MTSGQGVFARPISPTERMYLGYEPAVRPFAIQLFVVGDGHIDVAQLIAAVEQASAACPGARLVRRGATWVDSGRTPHVEQVTGPLIDLDCLDRRPLEDRPIGGGPGATTEVLLSHEPRTTVVFRVFHGVMDARGVRLWADDVFRVLRGERPEGATDPTTDIDLVRRFGADHRPPAMTQTFGSVVGHGPVPAGEPEFLYRHRTIAATAPAPVARAGAAVAAVATGPARLMIPVDLRRHDPAIRSTANLALPLILDVGPGDEWPEINASIVTGMVNAEELNDNSAVGKVPGVLVRGILRAATLAGRRWDRNIASAVLSHVGKLDAESFTAGNFIASAIRCVPAYTGLEAMCISMLESTGNTEVSVICRNGPGVTNAVDRLLDEIEDKLTKAKTKTTEQDLSQLTAPALFAAQVQARPDAVAVRAGADELTYQQLNNRAKSIAAHLQHRGVSRGDIIGVLCDRTPDYVAGQLGVLLAGCAFLPLDPKHPPGRRNQILRDARVALCLVDDAGRAGFDLAVTVIPLDGVADAEPHPVAVSATDIAYVTYTSGSTGIPKGVLVTHGGVANFIRSATGWYRLTPRTMFAHYHTQAADMACVAFFGSLMVGGTLVLIADEADQTGLDVTLNRSGANTFLFTPSLIELIAGLGLDAPQDCTVVIAGELLRASVAAKARTLFGAAARIVNSYGPTEMTMVCTNELIGAEVVGDAVSIGRPAANTPVLVLDAQQRPLPPGQVGELCFGGPQVANGYLHRAALTAERFIPGPDGRRYYRTGDLGAVRPDDSLDFLGRLDDQVKVRGNRIEPEEVRAHLEQVPGVGRAAVAAQTRAERTILVAFVVAAAPLDTAGLRSQLAERLPAYMIPAEFRLVPDLPLTANGKLDLVALTGETPPSIDTDTALAGQGDPTHAAIVTIWATVLRSESSAIDPSADFFANGGDSLSAVEMLAEVARSVVDGADQERLFLAGMRGMTSDLTIDRIHDAITVSRAGSPAPRATRSGE